MTMKHTSNYFTPLCPKRHFISNRFFKFSIFVVCLFGFLSSCQQADLKKNTSNRNYQKDLPFTKTEVKHAKGFTIDYFEKYKILNILNHTANTVDTVKYVLVLRGNPIPQGFSKSQVIPIPIQRLIGTSSVQIALTDFADAPDALVGLANLKYVSSQRISKNIKAGKIQEIGEEGTLNTERIISIKPDLLMGTGNPGGAIGKYQTLLDAGIPVLLTTEWLENTPLGRAEWVKVLAALLNKEELVNKKFNKIEIEYNRLAEIGHKAKLKPSIIVGMPFKGSWFVPDGTSFMAKFFKDAGASYQWANVKGTGSMGLSFEAVVPVALKADFWINSGTANSKNDIISQDNRYAYFKPYKNNTIYNFNKRVNDLGSNDYWESGVVNPQLVLADLVKILHPDLMPQHTLVYYKQIL